MEDIDMDEIDDYFRELRGERRSRAVTRTPGSGRRRKTPQTQASRGRGRSRSTAARKLSYPSDTEMRSVSRPAQGRMDPVLRAMLSGNNKPYEKQLKRIKAKPRKVRHKNARTVLNKMPAGGKPYAKRRKSMRKPKGAYRGAVMPRWAKGETKHSLMHDGSYSGATGAPNTSTLAPLTASGLVQAKVKGGELVCGLGTIKSWCMNPCAQGTDAVSRNGRSIDGTYLRIQGHVRNRDASNKAYVRMMVLAVKGGNTSTVAAVTGDNAVAAYTATRAVFNTSNLFKKIDGTIVGFDTLSTTDASGVARVRSLQLPVNKSLYTVLADQKMQLANTTESFGSSDRLFDLKIPLKQKTKFYDGNAASFETNQIVFVMYSVDPTCADAPVAVSAGTVTNGITTGATGLPLEFESKYSYKDF